MLVFLIVVENKLEYPRIFMTNRKVGYPWRTQGRQCSHESIVGFMPRVWCNSEMSDIRECNDRANWSTTQRTSRCVPEDKMQNRGRNVRNRRLRVFVTVLNIVNRTRNHLGQTARSDGFLLREHYSHEEGYETSFLNTERSLKVTALQRRIPWSSWSVPWEPKIWLLCCDAQKTFLGIAPKGS